jgi:hypothetical protein
MPCPFHPPWLDHSNYTWRRVQVMKRTLIILIVTIRDSTQFLKANAGIVQHTKPWQFLSTFFSIRNSASSGHSTLRNPS